MPTNADLSFIFPTEEGRIRILKGDKINRINTSISLLTDDIILENNHIIYKIVHDCALYIKHKTNLTELTVNDQNIINILKEKIITDTLTLIHSINERKIEAIDGINNTETGEGITYNIQNNDLPASLNDYLDDLCIRAYNYCYEKVRDHITSLGRYKEEALRELEISPEGYRDFMAIIPNNT